MAAFPGAGGKAQDLDLDVATLQRAGQNIGADRGDGNRPPAHRAGVIQQQGHTGVAEFGVLFDLERQRGCGIGHDTGQTTGIQRAFLKVEFPRPVLLRLQATL